MFNAEKSHGNADGRISPQALIERAAGVQALTFGYPLCLGVSMANPTQKSEILIHRNFSVQDHSKLFKGVQSHSKAFQKKKIVYFWSFGPFRLCGLRVSVVNSGRKCSLKSLVFAFDLRFLACYGGNVNRNLNLNLPGALLLCGAAVGF